MPAAVAGAKGSSPAVVAVGRHAAGRDGVEEPGAVEMHRHAPFATHFGDGARLVYRKDAAPGVVVRVLHRHYRGVGVVIVAFPDHRRNLIGAYHPVFAGQRSRHQPEMSRHRAAFVVQKVGPRLAHHLVPGPRECGEGYLVPHGAGRNEKAGLLAEKIRGELLEGVDGGIVSEDIVADLGRGHRLSHLRRGPRDGVASQVDHVSCPKGNTQRNSDSAGCRHQQSGSQLHVSSPWDSR
jgi:hypothetical protein